VARLDGKIKNIREEKALALKLIRKGKNALEDKPITGRQE